MWLSQLTFPHWVIPTNITIGGKYMQNSQPDTPAISWIICQVLCVAGESSLDYYGQFTEKCL